MKKLHYLMMMLLMTLCVACSDDDDPVQTPDASGVYTGYTVAKCAYFSDMAADDQSVQLGLNADGTYSVDFTSDTWGTFTVAQAKAEYTGGVFTFSGSGVCEMGMDGNVKEYDCTFTGTLDGSKELTDFTFEMPTVMGGLTIEFHGGDMPADLAE